MCCFIMSNEYFQYLKINSPINRGVRPLLHIYKDNNGRLYINFEKIGEYEQVIHFCLMRGFSSSKEAHALRSEKDMRGIH